MSSLGTIIKELDGNSDQTAKEVKASLDMLSELAEAKKKELQVFTYDRVKHASERGEIPAGLKIFEASEARVISSKGASEGISSVVDAFLGDAEKRWKEGVKSLIGTALNSLLGKASGATSSAQFYLIALDGHSAKSTTEENQEETYVPVRIDYSLWVYSFKREGLTHQVESALVYHAQKSLLDYQNIPSKIQIEQSLKSIGVPKKLREETIQMILEEQGNGKPKNLKAYSEKATPEVTDKLVSLL